MSLVFRCILRLIVSLSANWFCERISEMEVKEKKRVNIYLIFVDKDS